MRKVDILKRPIVTEKSLLSTSEGFYTFAVDKRANKYQIKNAVESQFGVKVIAVKTSIHKGKKKRFGRKRKEVFTGSFKKAMVKLKKGEKIDIFEASGEEGKQK